MKSALIYDAICLSAAASGKANLLKPVGQIYVFSCAVEELKSNKLKLPPLKMNHVSMNDGVDGLFFLLIKSVAKRNKVSLGKKSTAALAMCLSSKHAIVSSDRCVCELANSLNIKSIEFKL